MSRGRRESADRAAPRTARDPWDGSLSHGMLELWKANEYAQATGRCRWDFAVEIDVLRALGLSESDFRWLTCMGYVEHAQEVTRPNEDGRQFRRLGNLSFARRTCFVLTDTGVAVSRESFAVFTRRAVALRANTDFSRSTPVLPSPTPSMRDCSVGIGTNVAVTSVIPSWNVARRELRVSGRLVKRFKWPALNQELVLAAFEEEAWPARIDDPLPPLADQDPKRRLHDTIKCLNRKQDQVLIRFRGDGTGEGVMWDYVGEPLRIAVEWQKAD